MVDERPSVPRPVRTALAVALVATLAVAATLGVAVPASDVAPSVGAVPGAVPPADRGVPAGTAPAARAAETFVVGPGDAAAGWTVATGDVDGDGTGDLVVGAPAAGGDAGAVYVEFGPLPEGRVDLDEADATLVGAAGDRAGHALAVGDLDGDGAAEVVVGAPGSDAAGTDAGAVYVVGDGSLSGTVDLAAAETVLVGRTVGAEAGWSVGTVAVPAGRDLLVGAPHANQTAHSAGAVYRLDGAALPARASLDAANRTLLGAAAGDKAGWSVAGAGDADGDGTPDVVVGAKSNDTGGANAGVAYVVVEHGDGTAALPAAGRALVGATAGENAGFDVAGVGDVDGDGLADVLVGAPLADVGGANAGVAYLVAGNRTAPDARSLSTATRLARGENRLDRAGWTVAAGGDLLGCDGRPDPLVGAPWQGAAAPRAGAAYVLGARTEALDTLDDATTALRGGDPRDGLGGGLAGGADLNGDGDGDLAVAAPRAEVDGPGVVYVLHGDCPVVGATSASAGGSTATATPTATTTPGTATPTARPTATPTAAPTATPSPPAATATLTAAPPTAVEQPTASPATASGTGGAGGPSPAVAAGVAVGGAAVAAGALFAIRRFA